MFGIIPVLKIALRFALESNPPSRLRYAPANTKPVSLATRFHPFKPSGVVSLYRVHSLFGGTKAFVLSYIRLRKLACTHYRDTTHLPESNPIRPENAHRSLYGIGTTAVGQPGRGVWCS